MVGFAAVPVNVGDIDSTSGINTAQVGDRDKAVGWAIGRQTRSRNAKAAVDKLLSTCLFSGPSIPDSNHW